MKEQSTSRGFAYLSIAEVLVKVMSVIYVPLLVRILGDVGHGVYVISYDAFTFIYVLTNEGIQRGIAKLISELTARGNHRDALRAFRIARSLLILGGLIACLLLFFMAPYIADAAVSPQATLAIRALAPTVLITAVLSAYRGYFLGRSFITSNAISKIIEQLVNVVVSLTAAYFLMRVDLAYGVAGGTLGTSVGALVAAGLLAREFYKGRLHKVKRSLQNPDEPFHTNRQLLKKLFDYGIPITMGAGIQNLGGFIDMFIVNNSLVLAGLNFTLAKTAFSQLSRYKTLIYTPNTIIIALTSVLLPGISRSQAIGDEEGVLTKIRFAVKTVFMVGLPSAVGLTVLADPIYYLLYPGREGAHLLKYGAFVIIFMGFVQVQNVIYQSLGKFYWGIATLSLGILGRLATNAFFVRIPDINIMGAIIATFTNFIIPFFLNHFLLTRVMKVRMEMRKEVAKPLIAALVMGAFLFTTNFLMDLLELRYAFSSILTLVNVALGAGVYAVTLMLIGGLRKADIEEISPRLLKKIPSAIRKRMS